jgi:hypothetical protein
MPATARIPSTVWMQAIAVTLQATTVVPATSYNKNDSNIMTAHNIRNASNSRNDSYNRTANTVWMTSKAEMLLKSEMTAAAGTTASSWMSSAVGPPEQTVEKPAKFGRDTSNSTRSSQRDH